MTLQMDESPYSDGEKVIVVMDANRSKGSVEPLNWALKHVVKPYDTVLVLGVMYDFGKKSSCLPFHMGISIFGIWEKLEFTAPTEMTTLDLEEEISKKREQYQNDLQPFYRRCKKNEVKLEVKIAAGFSPREITVEEARNSNTRWIVLDSHLKKEKVYIYGHVRCNVAVIKAKDVATLMLSKASEFGETFTTDQPQKQQTDTLVSEEIVEPPESPCWHPLSRRTGFPRAFSQSELEVITKSSFSDHVIKDEDGMTVHEGIFKETPVLVRRFSVNDSRFMSSLKILSRIRHRNILNLVGYCCTDTALFFIFDFPCKGILEKNLQSDESAMNLPWKMRWQIALDIAGSLRYLHEECVDGPIIHHSVSSYNISFSHGWCPMLGNFTTSKWLKDELLSSSQEQAPECQKLQEYMHLSVDIRDYGIFLVELISGKTARRFQPQGETHTLLDWALPLLETNSLDELMDSRLKDSDDNVVIDNMVRAALCCLKNTSGQVIRMSEVLTIVRGDQLAISRF